MIIRQEESTPIGDYFHDSGIFQVFNKLSEEVDEFEVETDDVQNYCDNLITSLKNIKAVTKKVETEYAKVNYRHPKGCQLRASQIELDC